MSDEKLSSIFDAFMNGNRPAGWVAAAKPTIDVLTGMGWGVWVRQMNSDGRWKQIPGLAKRVLGDG